MLVLQATTPGAAFLTDASSTAQATQQTAAAAAAKLNRARNRKAAVASGALSSTAQTALGALQVSSCCQLLSSNHIGTLLLQRALGYLVELAAPQGTDLPTYFLPMRSTPLKYGCCSVPCTPLHPLVGMTNAMWSILRV